MTFFSRIAAVLGFLAVALGAFGAHGLRDVLVRNDTVNLWDKAVFYHFIHAVMLFILADRKPFPAVAWWSFFGGILLFSGSLYLLAIVKVFWIGLVTPIGGVSFLVGWGCLVFRPLCRPGGTPED